MWFFMQKLSLLPVQGAATEILTLGMDEQIVMRELQKLIPLLAHKFLHGDNGNLTLAERVARESGRRRAEAARALRVLESAGMIAELTEVEVGPGEECPPRHPPCY